MDISRGNRWVRPLVTALVVLTAGMSALTSVYGAEAGGGRKGGSRQVLAWADIESGFQGKFAIPMAQEGDHRFGYSEAVHTQLEGGNLLLDGHPYYYVQAEVAVPAVLVGREGARVGPWVDYTQSLLPDGWSGGEAYLLGGMPSNDDRLIFAKHQWHNGSGTDWQTRGY